MKITYEGRLPSKRQRNLGLLATVLILNKKHQNKRKSKAKTKQNHLLQQ